MEFVSSLFFDISRVFPPGPFLPLFREICTFMTPQNCLNLIFWLYLGPSGHGKTSGDVVARCMPAPDRRGCHGTRVMTIFGSYVAPFFPNIGYFKVYGGI